VDHRFDGMGKFRSNSRVSIARRGRHHHLWPVIRPPSLPGDRAVFGPFEIAGAALVWERVFLVEVIADAQKSAFKRRGSLDSLETACGLLPATQLLSGEPCLVGAIPIRGSRPR
jgi:hypothetical protein